VARSILPEGAAAAGTRARAHAAATAGLIRESAFDAAPLALGSAAR